MRVEIIKRDIVAMTWGTKCTYMVKAWSLKRCTWRCLYRWYMWLPRGENPAETMRELVDKHRTIPAAARDESITPWQQRALDEASDMA